MNIRIPIFLSFLLLSLGVYAQEELTIVDAAQLYSEGKISSAKALCEKLHAKDSTDDAANYYLGLCEYASGQVSLAEQHLKAAIRQDSTNCWYLHALASLYESQRRSAEAGYYWEKLVKLEAQNYRTPYTLTSIADFKISQHKDSIALNYIQEALDLDPEFAPAQIAKAELLLMMGNTTGYFLSLGQFISNRQVRAEIKSNYLKELMGKIDSRHWWTFGQQIENLMDTCIVQHPKHIQAHVNRLQIDFIKQDTTAWISRCEQLIPLALEQKDTTNLMLAMSVLGDTWHSLGDKRKAYKYYDEALKIKPDEVAILNNYAYFLSLDKKKLRKAREMSKRTIDLEPDNATYLDTYGWILHLLGKDEEAKPHFKRAMIFGGKESAVILEHYSIVLEALGENTLSIYYKNLADQKR